MKKNKGFVLAYTVIIMGIVFVVMAVLVAVVASQTKVDNASLLKFEQQMFVNQQEYNYQNLSYDNYSNYLSKNSINKEEKTDSIIYLFDNYVIELNKDYSHIVVYNVDKSKILYEVKK